MSDYPDCHESTNVLCKHTRSTITVYVDLDQRLPAIASISNPTADATDTELSIDDIVVITEDTVIESDSECGGLTLKANRAIQMTLSGGTPDDDEATVTVGFDISDGDTDYLDCRILIGGRAAVESA